MERQTQTQRTLTNPNRLIYPSHPRDRERQTEKEKGRQRQTDRGKDRQTDRHRDKERQTDK